MEAILSSVGLSHLLSKFISNKVGIDDARLLTDENLNQLGVATIGDRIRLRDALNKHFKDAALSNTSTATSSGASALFRPSRSRYTNGNPRQAPKGKTKTWTGTFFCMADKTSVKVPDSSQKVLLKKAGLGEKRIQFHLSDNQETIISKLKLEFNKLENVGGIELLRCEANCRTLSIIECEWSASCLRSCIGSQAKIYIRPIQKNASIESIVSGEVPDLWEECVFCGTKILVRELRAHSESCRTTEMSPGIHPEQQQAQEQQQQQFDTQSQLHVMAATPQRNQPQFVQQENQNQLTTPLLEQQPVIVQQQQDFDTQPQLNVMAATQQNQPQFVQQENQNQLTTPLLEQQQVIVQQQQDFDTQPQLNVMAATQQNLFFQQPQPEEKENEQIELDDLPDLSAYVINCETLTEIEKVTRTCISGINDNNIEDPIHMLRYIQKQIVTGRKLEIDEEDLAMGNSITGDTNFIVVDRQHLLASTFENIPEIENLRLTLEVNFCEERAEDYGGPRKEFFSLLLPQLYEMYFDPVKDYLEEDYETVGKIFALSMLQNGKLPRIFNEDLLSQLMGQSSSGPISYLKRGMNALGFIEIAQAHPMLLHLLTPENKPPLSLKMLLNLLKPQFSPAGSNQRVVESALYQKFVKYVREVAAGRRHGLTLGRVLCFATAVEEEPPLGFSVLPTITFAERESYLPTSNTCINKLILTIPSRKEEIPEDLNLFDKFDYAFCNVFFGLA